jgi:hypothetical protein
MAKKSLKSNEVVDNNTIKPQSLKPKEIGNKNSNFSKFFKKYQTAVISFALLLVLLVGGSLAYFKISNKDKDSASAGLNCPSGYNWNSSKNTCESRTTKIGTTTYACADGTQNNTGCAGHGSVDTAANNNNDGNFYSGTKPVLFVSIPEGGSAYGPICPNNYSYVNGNDNKIALGGTTVVCHRNDTVDTAANNNNDGNFYSGTKPVLFVSIREAGSAYGPICPNNYSYVNGNDNKIALGGTTVVCHNSSINPTSQSVSYSCPDSSWNDEGADCAKYISPASYTIDINTGISACNPSRNNLNSGDTFNCTFNLSGSPIGSYTIPSEGLYGAIRNTSGDANTFLGNSSLCTIAGTVLTCNNIPTTGASIGSKEIILHQPNVNWYPNKGILNIATTSLSTSDIPNLAITCTSATVKSTTTCTFNLPTDKTLPADFKLSIGDEALSPACTASAGVVTCNSVPTGTQVGSQIIYGQIGTGTKTDTGKKVTIDSGIIAINNQNLTSALSDCTNATAVTNNTYSCTFSLKPGYQFPGTGTFQVVTSNSSNASTDLTPATGVTAITCAYTPNATSGNLTCNNIPAGTNTGSRNILLRLGTGSEAYTDKGDVTIAQGLTDMIFLPPTTLTESPNPSTDGLSIFKDKDYSLTIKDARLVENSKTSVCYFKIKEVTSQDNDATRGYDKLTSTVLTSTSTTTPTPVYDATTKSYKVTYDATNGVNIKLAKANQSYTDYNLQVRCTRSDNQLFGRDQKINFLFGAYSVVDISGVGV